MEEGEERGGLCACEALTASTVGTGDCQAAAKYTQGSVSGSSSALSEQRFRFSDKRGILLAEVKWQLWQWRGRGLGTPANVCEDLTCRRLIGTRRWRGGCGSCHRGPQISSQKDWGCPALFLPRDLWGFSVSVCFIRTLQKISDLESFTFKIELLFIRKHQERSSMSDKNFTHQPDRKWEKDLIINSDH